MTSCRCQPNVAYKVLTVLDDDYFLLNDALSFRKVIANEKKDIHLISI